MNKKKNEGFKPIRRRVKKETDSLSKKHRKKKRKIEQMPTPRQLADDLTK